MKASKNKILIFLGIILLSFLQIKTTNFQSLTNLNNDEQRIKEERIKFYNPSSHYVRIIFHRLKIVDFLEGDFHTVSTRLQRNFFETIDPNVYFFGGHPRERVWANDFEKFPGILILPFLVGFFLVIKNKERTVICYLVFAIILLSIIGHKNNLGPFILYPIFVYLIVLGSLKLFR